MHFDDKADTVLHALPFICLQGSYKINFSGSE